jgi:hypothetical protein
MAMMFRPGNGGQGKRPGAGGNGERPPRRYDDEYEDDRHRDDERLDEIITDDRQYARFAGGEVVGLLRTIEKHRAALEGATACLQRWIYGSTELTTTWTKFQAAGGVTADDFADFLKGRLRVRRIRNHRHLRLLVSNGRRPVRLRVERDGDGDDAA